MPKRIVDLRGSGRPLLDMPHAAYPAACRARLYAAWEFLTLSRGGILAFVFGIDPPDLLSEG